MDRPRKSNRKWRIFKKNVTLTPEDSSIFEMYLLICFIYSLQSLDNTLKLQKIKSYLRFNSSRHIQNSQSPADVK